MKLATTLNNIKSHNPCKWGWEKLLRYLDKTQSDDDPLDFKTILESNGLNDALWCFRSLKGHDREIRLYAVWCARQVEYLDKSGVAKATNDISERFANRLATNRELKSASDAARDATGDVTWAACAATWATYAATWAACAAARATCAATWAACAAAWAACAAARAAGDDARDAQEQQFIKMFCTED